MEKALEQALVAAQSGEVPVGAVVVHNQKIIAKGYNFVEYLYDVTAHAEIQAITAAANYIGSKYLLECTIYVTLEPCTMCAGALALSQLNKIVYGASDDKKGFTRYKPLIKHPKTKIISGILAYKCREMLKNFFIKKRI